MPRIGTALAQLELSWWRYDAEILADSVHMWKPAKKEDLSVAIVGECNDQLLFTFGTSILSQPLNIIRGLPLSRD